MLQLYKKIPTDFLGQIFLELFQFKTRSLFGIPCVSVHIPFDQGWISDMVIDGPTFVSKKWLIFDNLGQGLSPNVDFFSIF